METITGIMLGLVVTLIYLRDRRRMSRLRKWRRDLFRQVMEAQAVLLLGLTSNMLPNNTLRERQRLDTALTTLVDFDAAHPDAF